MRIFFIFLTAYLISCSAAEDAKNYHEKTYGNKQTGLRKLLYEDHIPTQSRIVGGTSTSIDEFSFFVEWSGCGASLIHKDIILSAAHCDEQLTNVVRVGSSRKAGTSGRGVQKTITQRSVHNLFNANTLDYDFLVMKLDSAVDGYEPVGLNDNGSVPSNGQSLTVVGYGTTTESGVVTNTLQKVDVSYVPTNVCNAGNRYNGDVNGVTMFCAGASGKGK
jgi:trypsin